MLAKEAMNEALVLVDELQYCIKQKLSLSDYPWERLDTQLCNVMGLDNPRAFVARLLTPTIPAAPQVKLKKLFDKDFEVGTFYLEARLKNPDFLHASDNTPFRDWIHGSVTKEVERLIQACPDMEHILKERIRQRGISVNDYVFLAMFLPGKSGKRLVQEIPNQIYQDVFTRIMSEFMFYDPTAYPYVEITYNKSVEEVSYHILEAIKSYPLRMLFNCSVAAGAVGVDMKSSASAASPIYKNVNNIIFYHKENESLEDKKNRMCTELVGKAATPFAIDFWHKFESDFINTATPKTLLWFHDDYAETIIDLLFIQKLLDSNKLVKVISIPRSGKHGKRFGNDASSMDIIKHMEHPVLSRLKDLLEEGRYEYSEEGPCWGAVHGLHLSEPVVDLILNSTAILVKGSRSYEMLQGIQVDAYFASMICRDFSESVFGIDAESGASIFIKQECGLPSFQGFCDRHKRKETLPNGKEVMLAAMTAFDYIRAIESPSYQTLASSKEDIKALHVAIKRAAKKKGQTVAAYIMSRK